KSRGADDRIALLLLMPRTTLRKGLLHRFVALRGPILSRPSPPIETRIRQAGVQRAYERVRNGKSPASVQNSIFEEIYDPGNGMVADRVGFGDWDFSNPSFLPQFFDQARGRPAFHR